MTADFQVSAVLQRGKYRLRYDHWPTDPAYFEVVGDIAVDKRAVLDLPGVDPKTRGVSRTAVFSAKLGENWYIFQTWPNTTDRLSPKRGRSSASPITSYNLGPFSRVAGLPGPLRRLGASLIGDATLHIEYETPDGGHRTIETKLATGEVIREW
jgi:hypothetical protein